MTDSRKDFKTPRVSSYITAGQISIERDKVGPRRGRVQWELTSRDTLHTTTTSETTDGRLRDTLDVVTKNLAVTLGTTLAETLSTFAT